MVSLWILYSTKLTGQESIDTIQNHVYNLGEVVISATIDKDKLSSTDILKYNNLDIAKPLDKLPSVVFSRIGGRNEGAVIIRGFDSRSVPVFLDGIPIYVPYDGYVDLFRFSTLGVGQVEVSMGFSSMTLGPNTLGGAINLVSTQPTEKFDLTLRLGAQSGNGADGYISLGTKHKKFYVQSGFCWYQQEYIPLSNSFDTSPLQIDHKLNNSYRKDWKGSIKFGFMPNQTDEYSINYIYQHGEKGNPLYLGTDPMQKIRFWQWPYWDKQSLYIINKTRLAKKTLLKTRFYYDQFDNQLNSYDDGSYSSQTKRSSFISYYNDETYGAQAEIINSSFRNNNLKLAIHAKNDHHSEHNEGEPIRHFSDNTFSFALENVFTPGTKLTLIPGLSYNIRNSILAEEYFSSSDSIGDYPKNISHSIDAQIGAYFILTNRIKFNINFASKTRFATMNDRYSYKLGLAIPNPDLVPENAQNYELAFIIKPTKKLLLKPEIFYSYLTNTIQLVDNVQGNLSQMQNTGISEFKGFDLTVNYMPVKGFELTGIWSYIDQKNISHPNLYFRYVPKNHIYLSVEKNIGKKYSLLISGEYDSKRYSSTDGSRIAPEYTLINFSGGYLLSSKIKIEAGINNILDKLYFVDEGYPEEGRNLYIALYYNLNR